MLKLLGRVLLVLAGAVLVIAIYCTVDIHQQIRCPSEQVIKTESEAIIAAKRLILREEKLFSPNKGEVEMFLSELAGHDGCCSAKAEKSLFLPTVWLVQMGTYAKPLPSGKERYSVIFFMNACGTVVTHKEAFQKYGKGG